MALHLNINGTASGRALNLNGTAGGQEISPVKENKVNPIINISGQADLDVNAKTEYTKPRKNHLKNLSHLKKNLRNQNHLKKSLKNLKHHRKNRKNLKMKNHKNKPLFLNRLLV